jgi:hypothetical protein
MISLAIVAADVTLSGFSRFCLAAISRSLSRHSLGILNIKGKPLSFGIVTYLLWVFFNMFFVLRKIGGLKRRETNWQAKKKGPYCCRGHFIETNLI